MKRNGIGTASFVFAVFVLIMTCLGVLSMYQASLQHSMSVRSIEYSQNYYDARSRVSRKIAGMQTHDGGKKEQTLIEPIDDTLDLVVTVKVENDQYRIENQYTHNHDLWKEDDSIQVWNGKE